MAGQQVLNMDDMRPYDIFFSSIWYATGTVSLVGNTVFLILIFTRSPPSLTPYKVFLINSAITDVVFSGSTTFIQCRLIPNKWAFAYVALGPAKYFGPNVSYLSYVVQLHSLFYLFLCFPLSFGFRYYVLVRPMPRMRHLVLLLFIVWLFPLAQAISFILSQSDSQKIREYLQENKPYYNLTGYVISGNHMIWQPMTPITLATIVLPMFPIYIVVLYFYKKVHSFLDSRDTGIALQASTKRGHKRLIKALTIQASLPLFFVFPPITIYALYHFEIINFMIIEYLVYVLFSFLPAVNPIVSIYFVRPYRISILRILHRTIGTPQPDSNSGPIRIKSVISTATVIFAMEDMRSYDTFFSCVWYATSTVSLLGNTLFLTLILTKSPPSLIPYKVFLFNSAITDLVFSASTTFIQCRLIPNKWAFAYVALGPAKYFGPNIAYLSYVVQLHSLFYLFLCFPLSFGFRYYILVRSMPPISRLILMLFTVWLFPLAQSISFILSQSDSEMIREYLHENKPNYNLTGYVISGNHMLWQPMTPITLATIVLPMFPIYIVILYFYKKVHGFLDSREGGMTLQTATKRGHKRLLKALTIQASLPLFFVFPPIIIYALYHLQIINFMIIEYLVYVLFSFLPAVNPIVSIYFVRPYRISILRILHRTIGTPQPNSNSGQGRANDPAKAPYEKPTTFPTLTAVSRLRTTVVSNI